MTPSFSAGSGSFERHFLLSAQRGDLSRIEEGFNSLPEGGVTATEQQLYQQYRRRFSDRQEDFSPLSGSVLTDRVVQAYREYWAESALDPGRLTELEIRLASRLEAILADFRQQPDHAAVTGIYEQAAAAVRAQGFHVLNDRSPPLRDLVIWKTEERRQFEVELTDGSEQVPVVFMAGFVSQGWAQFLSLGLISTSGWASDDTLYCAAWAYDLDSREFRVSYLQHEARHFADYRLYPGLDPEELEYRAKLTELVFAGTEATTLLNAFAADADPDSPGPHARANSRVARDMYQEIFGEELPPGLERWEVSAAYDVNPAARVLLERSSLGLVAP